MDSLKFEFDRERLQVLTNVNDNVCYYGYQEFEQGFIEYCSDNEILNATIPIFNRFMLDNEHNVIDIYERS